MLSFQFSWSNASKLWWRHASFEDSSFCVTSVWVNLLWFASGLASSFLISRFFAIKNYTLLPYFSHEFFYSFSYLSLSKISQAFKPEVCGENFSICWQTDSMSFHQNSVEEEWISKTWILSCRTRWAWESRRKSSSGISRFIIVAFRLIPMCVRNCNESKMRAKQCFTIKNNKSISLLTVIYLFLYRG